MLKRRNYPNLKLKPLEEAERKALIRMLLDVNSKKLSTKQEVSEYHTINLINVILQLQIAAQPQCGNPRFLRVLLDDITVWGQFDQLDSKIAKDLKASTTSQLYELLLER